MQKRISIDWDKLHDFLGVGNKNLKVLKESFPDVRIISKSNKIIVEAEDENKIDKVIQFINDVVYMLEDKTIDSEELRNLAFLSKEGKSPSLLFQEQEVIYIPQRNKIIFPQNKTQREYIKAIANYDIVIGIGPAGTGKTYLAVCMGMAFLNQNITNRLIISRPIIEAGESLGFLPGDIEEKVNPYLRPIYDALYETLGYKLTFQYLKEGIIEIAPLAYMRGRTLKNAYIILDEAQNTTIGQMKMFLSRLGVDSKIVITGDITQVDLPKTKPSGLIHAIDILSHINGIKFIFFKEEDIIRHRLVSEILKAYENDGKYLKDEEKKEEAEEKG